MSASSGPSQTISSHHAASTTQTEASMTPPRPPRATLEINNGPSPVGGAFPKRIMAPAPPPLPFRRSGASFTRPTRVEERSGRPGR